MTWLAGLAGIQVVREAARVALTAALASVLVAAGAPAECGAVLVKLLGL